MLRPRLDPVLSTAPDHLLLCTACGYVVDGLDEEGACPECGQPIRQSRPENNPGTPWQRRPSPRTWLQSSIAAFLRPRELFSRAAFDTRSLTALLMVNVGIATALFAVPGIAYLLWGSLYRNLERAPGVITAYPDLGAFSFAYALLPGFTLLLDALLTPPGYRWWYGWRRIRWENYRVVQAHASAAWIVSGLVVAAAEVVRRIVLTGTPRTLPLTTQNLVLVNLGTVPALLAIVIGVLLITWSLHQGSRAIRFTNLPAGAANPATRAHQSPPNPAPESRHT